MRKTKRDVLSGGSGLELRDLECPRPSSLDELSAMVRDLAEREHDYNTGVYAMSLAATMAFEFMASKLGATGFQACCADLDFLARIRGYKHGFRVIDYDKLLYPQYWTSCHFPTAEQLLMENLGYLQEVAREMLEDGGLSTSVREHLEWIVSLEPSR